MASSSSRSLVSSYTFDEKDLDDADLWAVIDSAAAAATIAGKSPKPLAIRYPNYNSPPTPVSYPSPQSKILQIPNRNPNLGRGLNEESNRPSKMARSRILSEVKSETPMALVTTAHRNSTPNIINSTKFSSPESYLSPGIRQPTPFAEVSPSASCVKNDPINEMRHSLSGSFPSATLFKEYQNTAMAVSFRFSSIHFCLFRKWVLCTERCSMKCQALFCLIISIMTCSFIIISKFFSIQNQRTQARSLLLDSLNQYHICHWYIKCYRELTILLHHFADSREIWLHDDIREGIHQKVRWRLCL